MDNATFHKRQDIQDLIQEHHHADDLFFYFMWICASFLISVGILELYLDKKGDIFDLSYFRCLLS